MVAILSPAAKALDKLDIPYRQFTHPTPPSTIEQAARERNQEIGISGDTGKTYGANLHFEVRKNGNPIDPCKYLDAPEGCYIHNRCMPDELELESYVAQVPLPGAQADNLKKQVELTKV